MTVVTGRMGHVVGPDLRREAECEAVLRSLPRWFGVEASLREYASASGRWPTFGWETDAGLEGFVTLREHFPAAWEIYCIAVRIDRRGEGVGSALLAHAESWLQQRQVRLLQVKTLAPAHPSTEYAQTRGFYSARGFGPVEVFPELWSKAHPALQMLKVLSPG